MPRRGWHRPGLDTEEGPSMQEQAYLPDPASQRATAYRRAAERKRAAFEKRWHTIYKLYGDDGRLLYVGISANGLARFPEHQGKPWWRKVARAEMEHVEGRTAAEVRELELIESCAPVFNVAGKPDRNSEETRLEGRILEHFRWPGNDRCRLATIAKAVDAPVEQVEARLLALQEAQVMRLHGTTLWGINR